MENSEKLLNFFIPPGLVVPLRVYKEYRELIQHIERSSHSEGNTANRVRHGCPSTERKTCKTCFPTQGEDIRVNLHALDSQFGDISCQAQ